MAVTVYQWTDNDGVVHFSDKEPEANRADLEIIEFDEFDNGNIDSDKYSIVNQLERMSNWRRQITEERLARKQLQLEKLRITQMNNSNRYIDSSYQPVYYYYPAYFYPIPVYDQRRWHRKNYSISQRYSRIDNGSMGEPTGSFGFQSGRKNYHWEQPGLQHKRGTN